MIVLFIYSIVFAFEHSKSKVFFLYFKLSRISFMQGQNCESPRYVETRRTNIVIITASQMPDATKPVIKHAPKEHQLEFISQNKIIRGEGEETPYYKLKNLHPEMRNAHRQHHHKQRCLNGRLLFTTLSDKETILSVKQLNY